jgi:hypothetical protein
LRDAGVYILKDCKQVTSNASILLIDSFAYRQAFQCRVPALIDDIRLILNRESSTTVISVLIEGDIEDHHIDFRDDTRYIVSIFELILKLYAIPLNHPAFTPLIANLERQWQQTLRDRVADVSDTHQLLYEVRQVLLKCDIFHNDSEFHSLFIDPRLAPWQNRIPSASTVAARVGGLIDLLHNQSNTDGDNALALFLQVLSERLNPQDALREKLSHLAQALNRTQNQ